MANSPLVGKTTPGGEPLLKSMPAKTENGWSENGKKTRKEEGEKSPGIHASHVPSYLILTGTQWGRPYDHPHSSEAEWLVPTHMAIKRVGHENQKERVSRRNHQQSETIDHS